MRSVTSIKNISSNIISFIINIILTFFLRKVMVSNLGYEYIGLNVFLTSIVGFLSLGDLGVSQAVTYSLYKPLSEKNNNKISEILTLFKKIYQIVGSVIFFISMSLLLFIDKLINNNNIKNIGLYFFVYILMTVSSYFLCYRDILINADQKGYKLAKINTIFNFINKIFQICILIKTKSFLIWITFTTVITIINYFYTNNFIKKRYEKIDVSIYKNFTLKELLNLNPELLKNTYTTFVYRLSLFITYKTDDILITNLIGVSILGKYSNYVLVISLVASFIAKTFWSLNSVVGNYIVENSQKNIYKLWETLTWLSFYVATVSTFSIIKNMNQFLIIWVGKDSILNSFIFYVLMINFYIRIVREPIELFRNGFGIFDGTKKVVIVEAVLNLIISITLGIRYGIIGIILGTLISYLLGCFWFMPYITFKHGFKQNQLKYYKIMFNNLLVSIISMGISLYILNKLGIRSFIYSCIVSFISINVVYLSLSLKNKNFYFILDKIKVGLKIRSKK